MNKFSEMLANPTEPAPRPVRRRVGLAVVMLIAFLFGGAALKHAMSGGLADSEVRAGLDDLVVAVQGDASRFAAAEDHFVDAASVSVFDPYPAFLIRTTRRLAGPRSADDLQDRIAATLLEGDRRSAQELVDELRTTSERSAELWDRVLEEFELRLH